MMRTPPYVGILLVALAVLQGCGRALELDPRQTLTVDDLAQSYQVAVFATASGPTRYEVTATFIAGSNAKAPGVALPEGDTVTVNGAVMTLVEGASSSYTAEGSGNPGSYHFVWTHGETTYENDIVATVYLPATEPATIAKSGDNTIAIADAPDDVALSATVNAGSTVGKPFFVVPVEGGANDAAKAADLSGLEAGAGVLVILETWQGDLAAPTAAGGELSTTVQIGYNVTITD